MRLRLRLGVLAVLGAWPALAVSSALASETIPASPAAILQEIRSFGTLATVLHIAAHPDDENTALITYFARGRGCRTAYLSLTRGDGGQNEIGREFDEKLGLARTQELLAARKLDGGRQFFTRAIDFGFSKTPEETLRFWDRDLVLADVVRIIRQFQPDVIVTRFPIPPGSGGHGHHTASGILGVEAFKLAGDPKAYPDQQAQGLKPWQAKRVAWNGGGGGRGGGALTGPVLSMDIGGNDPVTGEPLGAIAGRSRAMHITQGFGNFGGRGGGGPNIQTFTVLGGEPAAKDLLDGVDTTWARVSGGSEIGSLVDNAIADFKAENPAASVPTLLRIRTKLAALGSDRLVQDKRAQLDRILQACLGLEIETVVPRAEVAPGESISVRQSVSLRADFGVTWVETRTGPRSTPLAAGHTLRPGIPRTSEGLLETPEDALPTQPYWLRQESGGFIFKVEDPNLIGRPENPPVFSLDAVFEVGGQTLVISSEPVTLENAGKRERRRRVDVVPPVSLRFGSDVLLFAPGATRSVIVEVEAARSGLVGEVKIEPLAGWTVAPSSRPLQISRAGDKRRVEFLVTAPSKPASARLTASAMVNGKRFSNQRIVIEYPHLPLLLLQPAATARAVCLEVAVRGKTAGYLPGAGDDTIQALEQLGYSVRTLSGTNLTLESLRGLDVVVVGVRAFNERKDLAESVTNLFGYAEGGGTVVVQYNRPTGLSASTLGPYPLSIQGSAPQWRVTDERAPVTFLAPEHPALTTPNRIVESDFDGWFQERGAYFPSNWDKARYESLLAMSDPGEAPLRSGILIARHGKGHYVYTGLAFFRQLPQGVPGAYRLFANLLSLGK